MSNHRHPAGPSYMVEPDEHDIPDIRVLSNRQVTARVSHRCDTCDGPIRPGTVYQRIALIDEDRDFCWSTHHLPGCCPAGADLTDDGDDDIPF
jgi:hypothetical protein